MKTVKPNSEITGSQSQLKTGNCLRELLKRSKDYFLMTTFKKLLQKIANLEIL